MKALVLRSESFRIEEVETPQVNANQLMIKIKAAALNRRDQWIRQGKYAKIQLPAILGSDGMGEVVTTGEGVSASWIGKKVLINPNINWGNNNAFQAKEYHILGMPTQGTLAEYLVVNEDRVHEVPQHLSDEAAAALPLAGLTAYNALFNKGQVERGKKVLISGVGGGVAQMAFQLALAVGAKVWVSSSKEEVLQKCLEMGAEGTINYLDPDALKGVGKTVGGFDIIIDSACGEGMGALVQSLAPGGKLVFYGATQGVPASLPVHAMFWNHWSILGSTMGSDSDFEKMLEFVALNKLTPLIDRVYEFKAAVAAFDRMKDSLQFGKIVVKVES